MKSMEKTSWFIAEERWTDYLRLGFGPSHVPCYVPETAKNDILLLRELREGMLMKGVAHCGYVMIAELIVCRTIVSRL